MICDENENKSHDAMWPHLKWHVAANKADTCHTPRQQVAMSARHMSFATSAWIVLGATSAWHMSGSTSADMSAASVANAVC